jgi:hypothetical protein
MKPRAVSGGGNAATNPFDDDDEKTQIAVARVILTSSLAVFRGNIPPPIVARVIDAARRAR